MAGEKRRLQAEIDKTLRQVDEDLVKFQDIYQRLSSTANPALKEKYELELKKRIGKLRKKRDAIKSWQTSNDVKIKEPLEEYRLKIEKEMQRFNSCEKEIKTKAFSKEGLSAKAKVDPHEEERNRHRDWLNECITSLTDEVDTYEAEQETLLAKKGKSKNPTRSAKLAKWICSHKLHLQKLQQVLRRLENDAIIMALLDELHKNIKGYLLEHKETDYNNIEGLYSNLCLDDGVDEASDLNGFKDSDDSSSGSARDFDRAADSIWSPTSSAKDKSEEGASDDKTNSVSASWLPIQESKGNMNCSKISANTEGEAMASSNPSQEAATSAQGGNFEPKEVFVSSEIGEKMGKSLSELLWNDCLLSASASSMVPNLKNTWDLLPAANSAHSTAENDCCKTAISEDHGKANIGVPVSTFSTAALSEPATLRESNQMISLDGTLPIASSSIVETAATVSSSSAPSVEGTGTAVLSAIDLSEPNPAVTEVSSVASATFIPIPSAAADSGPSQATLEVKITPTAALHDSKTAAGEIAEDAHGNTTTFGEYEISADSKNVSNMEWVQEQLKTAYLNCPTKMDSDVHCHHIPRIPWKEPHPSFPLNPLANVDSPELFEKMDLDTLFFVFYYRPGTYHQYLAAKELKKKFWRFHKQCLAWFQRHDEPRISTETAERGNYIYFDYKPSDWCFRVETDFLFEYANLENELME